MLRSRQKIFHIIEEREVHCVPVRPIPRQRTSIGTDLVIFAIIDFRISSKYILEAE